MGIIFRISYLRSVFIGNKFIIPFLARGLSGFAGFLITTLMIHYLKPEQTGVYYIILAYVTFFHWFFINPISSYIMTRSVKFNQAGFLSLAIRNYLFYLFLLSLLSILINYILLDRKLVVFFPNSISISLLSFFVLLYAASMSVFFISLLNMLGLHFKYYILLNVDVWGRLIVSFLFFKYYKGDKAFIFILSTSFISITVSLISLYLIKFKGKISKTQRIQNAVSYKGIIAYSWPISASTFFQWFQSQGWKIILERISSVKVVGLVSIASSYSIALISILAQVIDQILLPKFYEKFNATKNILNQFNSWKGYAARASTYLLLGSIPVCIMVVVMISRVSNGTYTYLIPISILFLLSELLRVHISIFQQRFFAGAKTLKMLFPFFSGSLILIPLLYFGYRFWALYGVSTALISSGLITLGFFYVQSRIYFNKIAIS